MEINYQYLLEIDVAPAAEPVWKRLATGWKNLAQALNEVIYQASYLGDNGWGSSEVTGGQYTITLTGDRIAGDEAQDFIFSTSVQFSFGAARKTKLRLTEPNGRMITWPVTLANIGTSGGDSNQPNAATVTIHGNGAPTISGGTYLGQLTIVSVAGSSSGDTAVYVNPLIGEGNSYKYKTAASVDMPTYDQVLTTGWAAWNCTADIAATSGHQIVIAEVETATNKAKKAGRATITAAS